MEDCAMMVPSVEEWAGEIPTDAYKSIISTPKSREERACSLTKRFGGNEADYEDLLDHFELFSGNCCYLTHSSYGVYFSEQLFGIEIPLSGGRSVPVRYVAEWIVAQDCNGIIPPATEWLSKIRPRRWMSKGTLIKNKEVA
jgi:hypothetical protein